MKKLLMIGVAVLFTGGVAAAQDRDYDDNSYDRDRDRYETRDSDRGFDAAGDRRDDYRRDSGDRDRADRRDRDRMGSDRDDRRSRAGRADHHRAMMMRHGYGHRGKRGGEDKAAEFTFDRGNGQGKIEIRCAAGESTRDCVDAVRPLLEAVLNRGGTAASPGRDTTMPSPNDMPTSPQTSPSPDGVQTSPSPDGVQTAPSPGTGTGQTVPSPGDGTGTTDD